MPAAISEQTVFELIDRVYAAGCDPAEWPKFVAGMQAAIPGTGVSTHLALGGTTLAENSSSAGIPDESLVTYFAHYQYLNPYIDLFRHFKIGSIERLSQLMGVAEIKRNPFYHEWLKPAGNFTHGAGLTIHRDERRLLRLAFEIPDQHSALEEVAAQLLIKLGPHVQRAFALNDRVAATVVSQSAIAALMDAMEGAAFVVTADGRVISGNVDAEALICAGRLCTHGLDNRLSFRQPQHQDAYLRALAAVANPCGDPNAFHANINGERSIVTVLPLTPVARQALASPSGRFALVSITPERSGAATPAELLRSLYGLTHAEAEVASRVAAGADATQISEQLQVSRTTVRNQITAAMGKMDVHRQAELVAKVSALGPKLRLSRKGKR